MKRKETLNRFDVLKTFTRIAGAAVLGFTLFWAADQQPAHAQDGPPSAVDVSGAPKATEEEASSSVWIEHQAEGYMLRCSGIQLFDFLILSALHCVKDGQDYLFDMKSTSIFFPAAPERGAVHPKRIFPLFFDVVLLLIDIQQEGNVTSLPLADETAIYANKNLKIIGHGGDGENSFTKWPNAGLVEVTNSCENSNNFVAVTSVEGEVTQGEPGDSGGGLTEQNTIDGVTMRSLIGIASEYCASNETENKQRPVKYSLVHSGPNRVAISNTVQLIRQDTFSMPPQTNTTLHLNESVASWEKVNGVDILADQAQELIFTVDHSNPTGQSTLKLAHSGTTAQFVPECVSVEAGFEQTEVVLENGNNFMSTLTVIADCAEKVRTPYSPISFYLISQNTLEQSFTGTNGTEVISSDEELKTRVSIHNPLKLDLSTLREKLQETYNDGTVAISTSVSSEVITFSVSSIKRPIEISFILNDGSRNSGIKTVSIPWTFKERETPGTELQRSGTIKLSEIFPPQPQDKTYLPLLVK